MVPSEIRNQSLKQLRQTFLGMTSAEWDLALEGKPEEIVTKAAKNLLTVQRARLRLQNAELSTIRDKLIENEIALEKGRQQVSGALKNLQEVEIVLEAVSSFLGVVARVVALL
jgi:hypothetical protein